MFIIDFKPFTIEKREYIDSFSMSIIMRGSTVHSIHFFMAGSVPYAVGGRGEYLIRPCGGRGEYVLYAPFCR